MSGCSVKMIDEFGEIKKKFGIISNSFIKKMNTLALESDLHFLTSLDSNDCNIYNILQIKEISLELILIKDNLSMHSEELLLFESALKNTLKEESYTYLKISCLSKDQEIEAPFQQFF